MHRLLVLLFLGVLAAGCDFTGVSSELADGGSTDGGSTGGGSTGGGSTGGGSTGGGSTGGGSTGGGSTGGGSTGGGSTGGGSTGGGSTGGGSTGGGSTGGGSTGGGSTGGGSTDGGSNHLPVINAGPDQTIQLPASSIVVAGSATDSDGDALTYNWSKTGGAANILSPASATSQVTGLMPGAYTFTLTVNDGHGGIVQSSLLLDVLPTSGPAYYFSTALGDDLRTAAQARNPATPWKSITRLNAMFSTFSPGDSVLFRRGEEYLAPASGIVASRSGSTSAPITFGAYGSRATPVITGFTVVSAWTPLGGNIWESTTPVSTLSTCNMVSVNGLNTAMGRTPNSGYLQFQSHTGNTSITSSSLTGTPNWTGAEVVIRVLRWAMDRNVITAQSAGTLTYTSDDTTYSPSDGWGFFIQNDSRTLDQQNEWYFSPSSQRLRIYSATSPGVVKVAGVNVLVSTGTSTDITFRDLAFEGANDTGIKTCQGSNCGQHISIENCAFNFSGQQAIDAYPNSPYLKVSSSTFDNSNDIAINAGSSSDAIITRNTVRNSGVFQGMANTSLGTFKGIHSAGDHGTITHNMVVNSGYIGIDFDGDGTIVEYNLVDNYCFVLDDGGGIYAFPTQGPGPHTTRRSIAHNIVINGPGAGIGADPPVTNQSMGIYLDGQSSDVNVIGNSVANAGAAMLLNNTHESRVDSNTFFDSEKWTLIWSNYLPSVPMSNMELTNNIFVARSTGEYVLAIESGASTMPADFVSDYNYYARPIDDTQTIHTSLAGTNTYQTFEQWQALTGQEAHSHKSPKSVASVGDLRFEYNASDAPKTVTLDDTYVDVKNTLYSGSLILAPWTSVVLIRN